MNQLVSVWTIVFLLRHVFSAEDVTNHPAWKILDKFDCGYSVADRIIGGDFAALGQFPWVTRLGFTTQFNDLDWPCGGALLTDQHVLTAAHCLVPSPDVQLSLVRMGELNMLTNPDCERGVCAPPIQDKRVKTVISHPFFNMPTFYNDIGIIVLDSPVQLNDYVTPVCLPKGELLRDLPIGEYITAAGWGKTNMTTEQKADRLKFVALPIVQTEACNYFGKTFEAGPSHICAGGKINEDACGGDSGGPLMKVFDTFEGPKSFAVGVVSFGPTICGTNRPAVYTKVSNFIEWILDNIEQTYQTR